MLGLGLAVLLDFGEVSLRKTMAPRPSPLDNRKEVHHACALVEYLFGVVNRNLFALSQWYFVCEPPRHPRVLQSSFSVVPLCLADSAKLDYEVPG